MCTWEGSGSVGCGSWEMRTAGGDEQGAGPALARGGMSPRHIRWAFSREKQGQGWGPASPSEGPERECAECAARVALSLTPVPSSVLGTCWKLSAVDRVTVTPAEADGQGAVCGMVWARCIQCVCCGAVCLCGRC